MRRGVKKLLPSLAKFTPSGEASQPAPINAPVSAWVVEMGNPRCAVPRSTAEAAVSAANPSIGCSLTSFIPRVRMIRLPPEKVPSPMVTAEASFTQSGTKK